MTNDELVEVFERDPELYQWTRRTFLKRTGALVVTASLAEMWAVACGGATGGANTDTTGDAPGAAYGAPRVLTQWKNLLHAGAVEGPGQGPESGGRRGGGVVGL